MKVNFWMTLPKPFLILAPMADVTDAAFRRLIARESVHGEAGGGPDVFFTEFVSADGLASPAGREKLLHDLKYSEEERPIVAQLFTSRPENMRKSAELARELGFDGVDINMGCPDRSIEKQGAGAALIKNPKLAQELIFAAKEGSGDLPLSVKTRIGYNKDELETWLPYLLEAKPALITIHARTRKEMSKVPARWERVARAVEIARGSGVLIAGNGDIRTASEGRESARTAGADGAMIGRAIFGTPWLFHPDQSPRSIVYRLRIMVEHTRLFEEMFRGVKNFAVMKKHYKAYANGFDGAHALRAELMEAENAEQVAVIVEKFLRDL